MFDIRKYPEVIEAINVIISNKGIAEIKLERQVVPTVVEIKRTKKVPRSTI